MKLNTSIKTSNELFQVSNRLFSQLSVLKLNIAILLVSNFSDAFFDLFCEQAVLKTVQVKKMIKSRVIAIRSKYQWFPQPAVKTYIYFFSRDIL